MYVPEQNSDILLEPWEPNVLVEKSITDLLMYVPEQNSDILLEPWEPQGFGCEF